MVRNNNVVCSPCRQRVLRSCRAQVCPCYQKSCLCFLEEWNPQHEVSHKKNPATLQRRGRRADKKKEKRKFGFRSFSPQFCFTKPSLHNAGQYSLPFLRNIREPLKSTMGRLAHICSRSGFLHECVCRNLLPHSHPVNPFTSSPAKAHVLRTQRSCKYDIRLMTALVEHFAAVKRQFHENLGIGKNIFLAAAALVNNQHLATWRCFSYFCFGFTLKLFYSKRKLFFDIIEVKHFIVSVLNSH